MISYKKEIGRDSKICERVTKKIVEYKNNVPQHQIAKALQLSSTVHNIIKQVRETEDGSLCKEKSRRSAGPEMTLMLIGMCN